METVKKEPVKMIKTEKDYLTVKELQSYLEVSRTTIFRWVKEGILTPYKLSGRVYFLLGEVRSSIQKSAA